MSSINNPATAKLIATGTFTGDGTDNRQITVGFRPSLVIFTGAVATSFGILMPNAPMRLQGQLFFTGGTDIHAIDGFVVFDTVDDTNRNLQVFYFWAISE